MPLRPLNLGPKTITPDIFGRRIPRRDGPPKRRLTSRPQSTAALAYLLTIPSLPELPPGGCGHQKFGWCAQCLPTAPPVLMADSPIIEMISLDPWPQDW